MKTPSKISKKFLSLGAVAAMGMTAPLFGDAHCTPNCAPHRSQNWAQLAYPDFCDVSITFDSSFGISHYDIRSIPYVTDDLTLDQTAFTLGLSQTLSVFDWFYVQLREDASLGFAMNALHPSGTNTYSRRPCQGWFFDGDAKVFVPFSISQTNRLSLQPVAGFALHQAYIKGYRTSQPMEKNTLLRQRFLAPLFGLALGYNPNPAFAVRTSVNMHFPHGKQIQPEETVPGSSPLRTMSNQTLRTSRHGMSMDLLLFAQLTPNWTLTGTLDYLVYRAYNSSPETDSENSWAANRTSRLSAKVGASYRF